MLGEIGQDHGLEPGSDFVGVPAFEDLEAVRDPRSRERFGVGFRVDEHVLGATVADLEGDAVVALQVIGVRADHRERGVGEPFVPDGVDPVRLVARAFIWKVFVGGRLVRVWRARGRRTA